MTTRWTPAERAAATNALVPSTWTARYVWLLISRLMPAQWTTASQPATVRVSGPITFVTRTPRVRRLRVTSACSCSVTPIA